MTNTLMTYNVLHGHDALTVGGVDYETYQLGGSLNRIVQFHRVGVTNSVGNNRTLYQNVNTTSPVQWPAGCYEIFNNDTNPITFRSVVGSIKATNVIAAKTSFYFYIDNTGIPIIYDAPCTR
jgi:hypothetical protein